MLSKINSNIVGMLLSVFSVIGGLCLIVLSLNINPTQSTPQRYVDFLEMQWAIGIPAMLMGICMFYKCWTENKTNVETTRE